MPDANQSPTPETRQASFTLPTGLVDRLDAVSERLLIGRSLIVERALAAAVAHLEGAPDPLAGMHMTSSPVLTSRGSDTGTTV